MRRIPAPTPPTSTNIPKIVAINFPPPNFFFGLEDTIGGKSGGLSEFDEGGEDCGFAGVVCVEVVAF